MTEEDYNLNFENFYEGEYSSLNPEYGNFIGKRLPANFFGSTTSIQTANQVAEVASRIKEGVKNVEIQQLNPDVFEQIPKQHFKEMQALMKISGVKPSLHAPIIDPAGFGEKGWGGEEAREDNERRFWEVVEKAHELDPKGNVPIVFHSTGGVGGPEFKKGQEAAFKDVVINQETRQMIPVQDEEKYDIGRIKDVKDKPRIFTVEKSIDSLNQNEWDDKMLKFVADKRETDRFLDKVIEYPGSPDLAKKSFKDEKEIIKFYVENPELAKNLNKAALYSQENHLKLQSLFDRAFKYGNDKQKEKLVKISKNWYRENVDSLNKLKESGLNPIREQIIDAQLTDKYFGEISKVIRSDLPKIYKKAQDFALDKNAQTFGNLAWKSYDKFKDKSPVIAVENMYQGMAFNRAKDLKRLVKESKKVFIKNAVKNGLSEGEAERTADKVLGVTWDVGHLNMIKKHGMTDKDVVAETKEIAPLVKHVHLTDNFGYADSHLGPGMGNVPFKKILEQLEKSGKLNDIRGVVEAGALTNPQLGLKMSPHKWTLGAFSSSVYGMKMAPYWNQVEGTPAGGYFGFPMAYMPEKHFSMYGSGFSGLPEDLGGQMPGSRSRFSGAGMA